MTPINHSIGGFVEGDPWVHSHIPCLSHQLNIMFLRGTRAFFMEFLVLSPGYRPLWQSLDQQALAQWNRLKEAMLPAVDRIKADVKALKERVEQREACCSSSVKDGEDSLQAIEDMEDIEDIEDIDMEEEHESGSNEGAESDQGAESWHSDIGSEPEEDMPTASPKVAEVADLKSEDPVSPEEAPSDTETKGLKRKREAGSSSGRFGASCCLALAQHSLHLACPQQPWHCHVLCGP